MIRWSDDQMIRWYWWSDDIDDLQATEKTILESLPTRKQAIIAVATAKVGHDDHDGKMLLIISKLSLIWFILKVLGHFAVDEMYLNNITSSHFGEEKARKVYAEFKRGLDKVVSILSENSIRSIFSAGGERNRREKREAAWRRQDPVHCSSAKEDPDRHSSVIFGRMFR